MPWRLSVLAVLLAGLVGPAPFLAGEEGSLQLLEQEVGRLAELAGGTVGVGAIHLETGREIYLNPDESFPMASTYKVPIAVQLLTRVDRGEITLDRMIELEAADLHPGSGTLTRLFDDPGVILSLRNLLELMLLISDNTATDLVLREAGGAQAVTARMRELGLTGITIDRPTVALIADFIGIEDLPAEGNIPPDAFRELVDGVPEEIREEAAQIFATDPRDTATPQEMTSLLARLWRQEILSPESSNLLLDIMRRSTTGGGRIKGLLPPETDVSHKTGTIGGTTNDVGIVELPADAGSVVTVIFVKESTLEVEERERAIAHIARAIHDYFLFHPGSE